MTLVDYASSSDGSDHDEPDHPRPKHQPLKRKPSTSLSGQRAAQTAKTNLPPLPASFHDLYASTVRTSAQDDPGLHGGRKRAVPHIEGNWPSHVYLEWCPSSTEYAQLSHLIKHVDSSQELRSLLWSDLGTPQPLHISLSRPLNLPTQQRQAFLSTLTSRICAPTSGRVSLAKSNKQHPQASEKRVGPIHTNFSTLRWEANELATRWFLVLGVDRPANDELNRLLRISNSVATAFDQDMLYADNPEKLTKRPKISSSDQTEISAKQSQNVATTEDYSHCFHVSIAWTLEKPDGQLLSSPIAEEQIEFKQDLAGQLTKVSKLPLRFDCVKVKIGNEVYSIELSDKIDEAKKGILG